MAPDRNPQSRYWLCTLSADRTVFMPRLPEGATYIRGQLELGEGGFLHWQFVVYFEGKIRFNALRALLPPTTHLTKVTREGVEVLNYCWKDDTCADLDSRFEFGVAPRMRRNNPTDWQQVYDNARAGNFDQIQPDVLVRHYGNLRRINMDNLVLPNRNDCRVYVYWGAPGTGKSRRAREEAGEDAYVKPNSTKWWNGYRGQERVIIDDFDGKIGLHHLKVWFDRYRCSVETKGGEIPLVANEFWITSNLRPQDWFPDVSQDEKNALLRRFTEVVYFNEIVPWVYRE